MKREADVRLLARRAPWSALEPEDLARAAAALRSRAVDRGEVIFARGDAFSHLFVVASGRVKVGLTGQDGREQILSIAKAGVTIGEVPLDSVPGRYLVTATALEDAVVWAMPRRDLEALLEASPAFARALLAVVAGRVRALVTLVEEVTLHGVPERLAAFLLAHVRRGGADGARPFAIVRSLAVETVAGRLGTVREEVQRALRLLADEKIIGLSRREIVVLDLERLERASWEPLG
jgi:CRP-like cAMP-binding protein